MFTEDQAEKKIKSIAKWHVWREWPKFELVSVDKYHKLAAWKEQHPIFIPMMSESVEMLKHLENAWLKTIAASKARISGGENDTILQELRIRNRS